MVNENYEGFTVVGRKAWDAYIYCFIFYFFWILVTIFISTKFKKIDSKYFNYVYLVLVTMFVYKLIVLKSYKIFYNSTGVFFSYGVLPWAKFGDGIRWNDADFASYYPNFLAWICNSYKISVKHKFTNQVDFVVEDVWRGRYVASIINSEIEART